MFKKPYAISTQNLINKKDLKKLKSDVLEEFPYFEQKKLDELLPADQVRVLKLDNRCLLYAAGDVPAFFHTDTGELYPTLSTLWKCPNVMPELTIHPEVSQFVLRGADLMLQGLSVPANGVSGLGSVTKGQKRCIKIIGNECPIAVGKMLVNQNQFEKLAGKGLQVAHVFKDCLWAHAGKEIPNAGFVESEEQVFPNDGSASAPAPAEPEPSEPEPSEPEPSEPADVTNADGGAQPDSSTKSADWSQDDLLEFTFLQAFTVSIADAGLPVEASELYEKHMKPRVPEGTTLDVKKSSHKQIGKFLNSLRKAKVLEVVEKKNVISVTKVDRGHKHFKALAEKFADVARTTAAVGVTSASSKAPPPEPVLTAVWKPTHYTEGLFKALGRNKNDLFTLEEVHAVLRGYIEKEGLAEDGHVKLNEELLVALVKAAGGQKKDAVFPDHLELDELEEKMLERMTEHTAIEVSVLGKIIRKGPAPKIEVTLSRKGAHNVTRISYLEAYGIDVVATGDELKKKLSCTAHIEDMPGKNSKEKLLQLQGHVHQELAEHLLERYGITRTFMSVK